MLTTGNNSLVGTVAASFATLPFDASVSVSGFALTIFSLCASADTLDFKP
jgi:hypothetical protein